MTGLAGVDAHGFPSYRSLFRVLRNYVLLDSPLVGDSERDAVAVLDALTRGRSYMAVEALAPAGAFFFHAARGNETWQMATRSRSAEICGCAPAPAASRFAIELYLDGRCRHGRESLEFRLACLAPTASGRIAG